MEKELSDLQERHRELTESYKASQLEYSAVKEEMETLRCKCETLSRTPKIYFCGIRACDAPGAEPSDPPLLDVPGILYKPTIDAV